MAGRPLDGLVGPEPSLSPPGLALQRAFEAADGQDVRLGGGVATVQSYLRAGLADELHLAISTILLGAAERLLDGLEDCRDLYQCTEMVSTEKATHVVLSRVISGPGRSS